MVTIEQVARRAGVSVATVSRTLNNSPAVKPATAQRETMPQKQADSH